MNAVNLTEAIFYELRPGDVSTEYVTEFNQLIFNILMNACDEEALNIVLRYERSDNGQQQVKKDGRRALFALMQTYSPVSTNAGNNAKAKLEAIRFHDRTRARATSRSPTFTSTSPSLKLPETRIWRPSSCGPSSPRQSRERTGRL